MLFFLEDVEKSNYHVKYHQPPKLGVLVGPENHLGVLPVWQERDIPRPLGCHDHGHTGRDQHPG